MAGGAIAVRSRVVHEASKMQPALAHAQAAASESSRIDFIQAIVERAENCSVHFVISSEMKRGFISWMHGGMVRFQEGQ
jgi:hypothetical protein